jgi:hypothetical protein
MKKLRFALLGAVASCAAFNAAASCGSAFCLVNTDWSSQGAWADTGPRFDLRYELIDLDQPMHGTDRIGVGEIPRHHDEVSTKNRNLVGTAHWGFTPGWALSLSVPYVDREHLHFHNHQGEQIPETWSFRELGDARVQAQYQFFNSIADPTSPRSAGVTFGVKLPTGKSDVTNDEGEEAERSLQPGTGTTDLLLGTYWHGAAPLTGWTWFAQAQAVLPMNSHEGYKPGRQLHLDGGVRRAIGDDLALMLQVNYSAKGRDSGVNAEPEDSGQRQLFASPGVSYNLGRNAQAYAFVQLPLYQAVNGVQLVADWSAVAGVSFRF